MCGYSDNKDLGTAWPKSSNSSSSISMMTLSTPTLVLCGSGSVTAFIAWYLYRKRQTLKRVIFLCVWFVAFGCLLSGAYSFWYHHRPLPEAVHEILFEGVTYIREIRHSPRPLVIHIVKIDLDAPGIDFLVTPGDPTRKLPLQARTTSQFLDEFNVQIAINAGFCYPWYARGPLWYYPHVGDPVNVYGLSISQGISYSSPESEYHAVYFSQGNHVSIGQSVESPYHAVSGRSIFLKAGELQQSLHSWGNPYQPSPRTVVALDKTGKQFMIFVVDGRQPNYSEGITLPELAQVAIQHGADTALNLDGGGSSTLVVEGSDGKPLVLNSPIHGRVPPGRERPVANHLGIFARRSESPL